MHKAVLVRTIDESPTVRTFWIRTKSPLDHQAGQFVEVFLPHKQPDNRGTSREFTLSSAPNQSKDPCEASFTVRRPAASPPSSFKQALWALQPGDILTVSSPTGDFVLPLNPQTPLVWISRGIGITPFRSHAAELAQTQAQAHATNPAVYFFYSYTNPHDIAFAQEIKAAVQPELYHIEQTSASTSFSAPHILSQLSQLPGNVCRDGIFYIAGSEAMVQALAAELQQNGLGWHQIVTDAFLGY